MKMKHTKEKAPKVIKKPSDRRQVDSQASPNAAEDKQVTEIERTFTLRYEW